MVFLRYYFDETYCIHTFASIYNKLFVLLMLLSALMS